MEYSELSVLLTTDSEIRDLNKTYRSKDSATDVLAFPQDGEHLGDVVISLETCQKQSEELGVGFEEELIRLLIHGFLHLQGYDHERGEEDAKIMREKEEELFKICMKK